MQQLLHWIRHRQQKNGTRVNGYSSVHHPKMALCCFGTLLTRALFFRFRWRRKRAAAKVIPFPMDLPDMFLEGQIETSEGIILVVVDRDGLRMVDRATIGFRSAEIRKAVTKRRRTIPRSWLNNITIISHVCSN